MLLLDLVQLQSQYHVFEVAFVTFLQAQDWLVELVTQVNEVVVLVVFVVLTWVAYWAVVTQHWNLFELLRQREVLVKLNSLVMLLLDLVQLQSQYHVLEVALVTFLQAQDWLVELVTQVNEVVVLVVFVVLTWVAC
jgi:hypothetical protein